MSTGVTEKELAAVESQNLTVVNIDEGDNQNTKTVNEDIVEEKEMDDLFGDDEEEEDNEGNDRNRDENIDNENRDDDDESITVRRRNYMDDDEDEEQAMYTRKFYGEDDYNKSDQEEDSHEFKEANIELVRHIVPNKITSGSQEPENKTIYAKVPPFLTINPIPFDPPCFEAQVKERLAGSTSNEERLGERLIDQNTIRWRYSRDADQHVFKESNSQIIQWSDGSFSLKLGDEYTDILVNDTDNTFLAVSHDQQELMQCTDGGEVSKSLMFVPISTTSKLHQRLSKAIIRRNQKATLGPRSMIINVDPEIEKKELEKKQSQMFRDRRKKKLKEIEAQQESPDTTGFGNNSYSSSRKRGGTPSQYGESRRDEYEESRRDEYEEDDFIVEDDEDELEYAGEEDDEEEEEEEEEENDDEDQKRAERLRELKRDATSTYQEDDDEEAKKRRKVAVIEDDEYDE